VKIVRERELLRRPAHGMVLGRAWVYGVTGDKLYFSIVFGAVGAADLAALVRLWRVELDTGGHLSLCDAGGLTSISPDAFLLLGQFLADHGVALAKSVCRQALVRPTGLAGTIVAGYYQVFPPPYPYRLFDGRDGALGWLGATAADAAALGDADGHAHAEPLLRALRERLAQTPGGGGLEHAARALAVAPRSLQRRLAAVGTSFQREVRRAQIERAMQLLVGTDHKLAAIATEVGCASASSFSELFAREVGVAPGVWRARRRQ
jgi:AraC-like DNA-binding protein